MRSNPCLACWSLGRWVSTTFLIHLILSVTGGSCICTQGPTTRPNLAHSNYDPTSILGLTLVFRHTRLLITLFTGHLHCAVSSLPLLPGSAGRSYPINKPRKQYHAILHRPPLSPCLHPNPPPKPPPRPLPSPSLPRAILPRCTNWL